MQAAYVVPAFQEGEDAPPCLFMGRELFARQEFCFKRSKEGFAHRIVVGVAGRTHRRLHAGFAAAFSERN